MGRLATPRNRRGLSLIKPNAAAMDRPTETRLDSAIRAAKSAGALIRDTFGSGISAQFKTPKDPVTEIDRRSEVMIRDALLAEHPEIEFWGEEFGRSSSSASLVWVVDPLDGTKNFVHGYPFVAVSIALVRDSKPLLGVVYDPLRDELFHATRGGGAYRNEQRLEVSRAAHLNEAMVVTSFHTFPPQQMALIAKACDNCQGLRRGGASALDLCQLAAGRLEAMWEWNLRPWDLAAAVLIIEEAQGSVTKVDGTPFDLLNGEILATNTSLHRQFVDLLST